jgi:prepilin-type N-terminal cleavage/methylation domain-containing protein
MRRSEQQRHGRGTGGTGGFTLVELMVAIALSGVVIGFVFQIHNQMVGALRGQANLSEVVEGVTAAREMIARELRLAGMGFPPSGVQFGSTDEVDVWHGVEAINDADGAGPNDVVDQLSIQRVDGDITLTPAIDNGSGVSWSFAVVDADDKGFAVGVPFLLYNTFSNRACAPVPTTVDPSGITVDGAAFTTGACKNFPITNGDTENVAKIRRIAFRLDPNATRLEMGVLQRSMNGAAWEDIGIGFSNFQVAMRFFNDDVNDDDADGDPQRDWYSSENMEAANFGRPLTGVPLQVTFSIEGRNLRPLDNLASSATPAYTDPVRPDNNALGDFGQSCVGAQYDPCGVPDLTSTTLPRYTYPNHVYRSTTTTVYLRSYVGSL